MRTGLNRTLHSEEGSMIVIALLVLVILTLIGSSITSRTQVEIQISGDDSFHRMAFHLADSGTSAAPKVISTCLDAGAEETITGVTYLRTDGTEAQDGTFYRELMGYLPHAAAHDLRFALDPYTIDVDVRRVAQVNLAGRGSEFAAGAEGDYLTGLHLEAIEAGTTNRYLFGIENGTVLVAKRVAANGSATTLAGPPCDAAEVTIRIRRTGDILRFEERRNDVWNVVTTQSLATGATTEQRGLFLATALAQSIRVQFDYAMLIDPSNTSELRHYLRISELMYHPVDGEQFEFFELVNTGPATLDLTGCRFVEGIAFTFGPTVLEPGERIVVTSDPVAFATRYDTSGIRLAAGAFTGRLDNGGERLTQVDDQGNIVLSFQYQGITEKDVLLLVEKRKLSVQALRGQAEPLSRMRQTIARRMVQSKQTIPHFYVTVSADVTAALALRERVNREAGAAVSITDLIVKATALALRENPAVNCRLLEDQIVYLEDVNVGIAVNLDDGVLVPIIGWADGLPLVEIARKAKEVAAIARQGKLAAAEPACFTVSNLGTLGVEAFTAIINPPTRGRSGFTRVVIS